MKQSVLRYSQIYELGDGLSNDSARMRIRLLRSLDHFFEDRDLFLELGRRVERECGIDVISTSYSPYFNADHLFRSGELRDIFDTLGFAFQLMPDQIYKDRMTVNGRKAAFRAEVARIFGEEAVGYNFDEVGVVRRTFDERFEIERNTTIRGLSDERFTAARAHILRVDGCLLQNPIDGREAVRGIFDAVENIYKMMFPKETHISTRSITNNLTPLLQNSLKGQLPEQRAVTKCVSSFVAWVESVHFYRHEAGQPVPRQPSEGTTLLLVGQGFGFARWLAAIASIELVSD